MARAFDFAALLLAVAIVALVALPQHGSADVKAALAVVPAANGTTPTPSPSPTPTATVPPSTTPSPSVTPTLKVNQVAQTWSFLIPTIGAALALMVIIGAVGFHLFTEFKKGSEDDQVDFVVIQ
eukprot:TRINITY_DN16397_c0_g1_i1.p2 TRINITY_DN16397_c0_g1~~TRINITY_DN16397_c0_g1_i1.p2  ORF type:complete len:124 (-),score=20.32 TRINITY_DN16397_c0_g1_i1:115-486(-)